MANKDLEKIIKEQEKQIRDLKQAIGRLTTMLKTVDEKASRAVHSSNRASVDIAAIKDILRRRG